MENIALQIKNVIVKHESHIKEVEYFLQSYYCKFCMAKESCARNVFPNPRHLRSLNKRCQILYLGPSVCKKCAWSLNPNPSWSTSSISVFGLIRDSYSGDMIYYVLVGLNDKHKCHSR